MTNKEFNKRLFTNYKQEKYIRVTRLNLNNVPIEQIEGRATGGSINVDGNSNVRRTCSLSLVVDSIEREYQWSLSSKIRVEIGLANDIDPSRPPIIWFKQGTFYLTSFSCALGAASLTVSLSGKDKMVKLNGELGGKMMAQTRFDIEEIVTKDNDGKEVITTNKVPIKTIIYKAVQQLGGEQPHNIVINDLDDYGFELLENKSVQPMYLARETNSEIYTAITLDGTKTPCWENDEVNSKLLSQVTNYDDLLLDGFADNHNVGSEIKFKNEQDATKYYVAKIDTSELAGYKKTNLIYPTELIANVGEALTSILDKICNFLGVFEYFYDLDGKFIFQRKLNSTNLVQGLISEDNGVSYISKPIGLLEDKITLNDAALLTQISRSPQISNIVNDFSIWGTSSSGSGTKPIHIRYAIDKKPETYTSLIFTEADWEVYKKATGLEFDDQELEDLAKLQYTGQTIQQLQRTEQMTELELSDYFITTFEQIKPHNITSLEIEVDFPDDTDENNSIMILYRKIGEESDTFVLDKNDEKFILDCENGLVDIIVFNFGAADTLVHLKTFKIKNRVYFSTTYTSDDYDWRELIYRMALDWYKGNYLDDFGYRLTRLNPWCLNGKTGYEQYYEDVQGFWRQLYNPDEPYELAPAEISKGIVDSVNEIKDPVSLYDSQDYNLYDSQDNSLYSKYETYNIQGGTYFAETVGGVSANQEVLVYKNSIIGVGNKIAIGQVSQIGLVYDTTPYYIDGKVGFPRVFNAVKQGSMWYVPVSIGTAEVQTTGVDGFYSIIYSYEARKFYYLDNGIFILDEGEQAQNTQYYFQTPNIYEVSFSPWRQSLINDPSLLSFWIDFLEPQRIGSLEDISVKKIGQRPLAQTDKDMGAIYYRQAPLILYDFKGDDKPTPGYATVSAKGYDGLFALSGKKKTGLEVVEDLLAEKAYAAESISFSMIPDYDLDINIKAKVKNKDLNIDGNYIINRLTIPLDYAGLIQVQAQLAPLSLY